VRSRACSTRAYEPRSTPDDLAYFPGYMNENVSAVQRAVNLTRDEIVQLARNAFTVSWLARKDRERYLDALDETARWAQIASQILAVITRP
jgi:adenosine deaminase